MDVSPVWEQFSTYSQDACWPWPGSVDRDGYGKSGRYIAHSLAYAAFIGPIPTALEIDHLCHTRDLTCAGGAQCQHRRCVNPTHLEAVTHAENVRRGRGGRDDRCGKGHLFDTANTYRKSRRPGTRICRQCAREAEAKRRSAKPRRHSNEGVSWSSEKGKWRVRLVLGGQYRHLGYFASRTEASAVARSARVSEVVS